MRLVALALLAASCGSSSLLDQSGPDQDAGSMTTADATVLPAPAADCRMYNPTACRLDLAQTSVAVDVNYPNTFFCGLQLLPTRDLTNTAAHTQLAASWQVSIGNSANDQVILTPTRSSSTPSAASSSISGGSRSRRSRTRPSASSSRARWAPTFHCTPCRSPVRATEGLQFTCVETMGVSLAGLHGT